MGEPTPIERTLTFAAIWLVIAAFVGVVLWPFVPHTALVIAGIVVLGPPLYFLGEFVGGLYLNSKFVRALTGECSLGPILGHVVAIGLIFFPLLALWVWWRHPVA